jgi:hypothetical protein
MPDPGVSGSVIRLTPWSADRNASAETTLTSHAILI